MNQLNSIILKQDSAFYKAALLSQSRIRPTDRMDNLSRPIVRVNQQRRQPMGTVGEIYKKFGQRRKV